MAECLKKIRLEELKDLKLRDIPFTVPNVCLNKKIWDAHGVNADYEIEKAIDDSCRKYVPDNGEFATHYRTSLQMPDCDSFDNSVLLANENFLKFNNRCYSDSKDKPKARGYSCFVSRNKFTADPKTCCLGDKDIIDNKTCDINHRGFTKECNQYNIEYCTNTNDIFTSKRCMEWCELYPDDCKKIKIKKCNDKDYFKQYKRQCMNFCTKNEGKCDDIMTETCSSGNLTNEEIPQCKCFNPDRGSPFEAMAAICDRTCFSSGYKTETMLTDITCPKIICNVGINGTDNYNTTTVNENTIINNCGATANHNTRTVSFDINKKFFPDDKRFSNLAIMIPSFIFIIIVFIIILWLIYIL